MSGCPQAAPNPLLLQQFESALIDYVQFAESSLNRFGGD
jgi:hypothetical protein